MTESKLKTLGAYELMKILHELHKLGYQKLRWMCLTWLQPDLVCVAI